MHKLVFLLLDELNEIKCDVFLIQRWKDTCA